MTCEIMRDGAVTIICCTRGARAWKPCSTTGCTGRALFLCDFPLEGKRQGQTCDRPVCAGCRRSQGPHVDYCRAHHEMTQSRAK